MSEIERVNEEPEFREYMSAEEDNRKIENSIRSEGYEDGINEGISIVAKEMKNKNYSKEEISQLTGLDQNEIEKL